MIRTLLICLVFAVLLGILFWRAAKGPARGIESLHQPIGDLLRRGYHGGFLLIFVGYSRRFIQLRKYIKSSGEYGIELSFPNAKWSAQYFDRLRVYCRDNSISHDFVNYDGPLEFLRVDFGQDVAAATSLIERVLVDVMAVSPDVKLFVRLENATINDELVTSTNR